MACILAWIPSDRSCHRSSGPCIHARHEGNATPRVDARRHQLRPGHGAPRRHRRKRRRPQHPGEPAHRSARALLGNRRIHPELASLLLLSGGLADRLGAKQLFAAGLVLFTLASAACGLAPDAPSLIAARIVQGAGAALFMPSSLSILGRAYPEPLQRARAIGIWSSLTAIA